MTRNKASRINDLSPDPFHEQARMPPPRTVRLLGGRFHFDSNSPKLLRIVDSAYARLPQHRLPGVARDFKVSLYLTPSSRSNLQPPSLALLNGAGYLGGATHRSTFVVLSPAQRSALIVVAQKMLRFPYHVRYEFLEFAVFTLAARAQDLVPLHAACIGQNDKGLLLMGGSGAGKSTVALHSLLAGLDLLSEDSVFVSADTLLATGVSNFLHVRAESLRWIDRPSDRTVIRRSPVIRRRSGVEKFEVDIRRKRFCVAEAPPQIVGIVFLSTRHAGSGPLLSRLSRTATLKKLVEAQPYAARQPQWHIFRDKILRLKSFELLRGTHPRESVAALQSLLGDA
ncbi:MAG: serine kinase [Pseudomonadota bacterium]|nr:serine kinase [Pseudomonadota bacterium]